MKRMEAQHPSRSATGSPSFAATKAAKKEYIRLGGQYVADKSQIPANLVDQQAVAEKKQKARIAERKRKNKGIL